MARGKIEKIAVDFVKKYYLSRNKHIKECVRGKGADFEYEDGLIEVKGNSERTPVFFYLTQNEFKTLLKVKRYTIHWIWIDRETEQIKKHLIFQGREALQYLRSPEIQYPIALTKKVIENHTIKVDQMGNCPSELTLLDYIENKLYDKERVKVEHHLKFCSDCISALSLAQNIPDKLPEVPEYMIEKAKKIPFERG